MSQRPPQMPGEQPKIDPETGLPPVLKNTNDDPNKIARDRERVLQATAALATGGDGEIAPPPPIDDGPAERTALVDGQPVIVNVGAIRRDPISVRYGQESQLPIGTMVNADGTVFAGQGQPFGVIGRYLDPVQGWVVNRIVPIESMNPSEKAT